MDQQQETTHETKNNNGCMRSTLVTGCHPSRIGTQFHRGRERVTLPDDVSPVVVRIPENFRHLVDLKPGTRNDGFIEFVDVGPTTLHLAGIPIPEGMDGKPFMGPGVSRQDLESRDETLGIADRFDEKYDLVRSLRKGRLKYIRSYQPFNFHGLQNNYRYKMASYRERRDASLSPRKTTTVLRSTVLRAVFLRGRTCA